MRKHTFTKKQPVLKAGLFALTAAIFTSFAPAEEKAPTLDHDPLDEGSVRGFFISTIQCPNGDKLTTLTNRYIVNQPEFDGGDGSDFDGGDGSDFLKDSFDGGDGPDYLNELVGSDAADSLVGSDAADSLVGSDAADSIFRELVISIALKTEPTDSLLVHELATGLNQMLAWTCESLGDSAKTSLKATGNEVAFMPFAERWDNWEAFRNQSKESIALLEVGAWADDFEALALLASSGALSPDDFADNVGILIDDIWWLNGVESQKVTVVPAQ